MRMIWMFASAVAITATVVAGRSGSPPDGKTDAAPRGAGAATATATMKNVVGRELGTLTLTDEGGRIAVSGRLTGIPPGPHAIHIHAVGKCDAPGFNSAGDHWNPSGREHGSRNPNGPHHGDLENVTVGSDGSVQVSTSRLRIQKGGGASEWMHRQAPFDHGMDGAAGATRW